MKKIAILTISTGKYIQLFENLKKTILINFLPNYEKTIFLFTDNDYVETNNIKIKKILHLPWPLNTLLRFNYFNTIIEELKENFIIKNNNQDPILYKNGIGQFDEENNLVKEFICKYDCIKQLQMSDKTLTKALTKNTPYNGSFFKDIGSKLKML